MRVAAAAKLNFFIGVKIFKGFLGASGPQGLLFARSGTHLRQPAKVNYTCSIALCRVPVWDGGMLGGTNKPIGEPLLGVNVTCVSTRTREVQPVRATLWLWLGNFFFSQVEFPLFFFPPSIFIVMAMVE